MASTMGLLFSLISKITINLVLNAEIIDAKGNDLTTQEQEQIQDLFEMDLTRTGKDLIQICKGLTNADKVVLITKIIDGKMNAKTPPFSPK